METVNDRRQLLGSAAQFVRCQRGIPQDKTGQARLALDVERRHRIDADAGRTGGIDQPGFVLRTDVADPYDDMQPALRSHDLYLVAKA